MIGEIIMCINRSVLRDLYIQSKILELWTLAYIMNLFIASCLALAALLGTVKGDLVNGQDARLVGTSRDGYSGRVEVYHEGHWYGICGLLWTQSEAEVVCKMLFPEESTRDQVRAISVTYDSADEAVPAFRCRSYAQTLHECQGFFDSLMQCRHNIRAGVTCVEERKKKDEDVGDDLTLTGRAVQLLLELLQDTKN